MIFPLKGGICGNYVRMVRGKVVKKPISYCYTPYFDNEGAIGARSWANFTLGSTFLPRL